MKILWAMDLIDGQAVRLFKGDFSRKTVYSDRPADKVAEMALRGALDFHVIDLDGARLGEPVHGDVIAEIRKRAPGYMETGGGIRSEDDIAWYRSRGLNGVIVGTKALLDPGFLLNLSSRNHVVLGLDMFDGKPMVRGWKEASEIRTEEILEGAQRAGVLAILYTSIVRDGTLEGPDFEGIRKMQGMTRLPIIASGGVSSVEDLKLLKEMDVWAAIVGKAFYEGRIGIEEAMKYAD
jgi:phosphoribosylformimino-5-aminoimidazole carboxamide ribotide isomerase